MTPNCVTVPLISSEITVGSCCYSQVCCFCESARPCHFFSLLCWLLSTFSYNLKGSFSNVKQTFCHVLQIVFICLLSSWCFSLFFYNLWLNFHFYFVNLLFFFMAQVFLCVSYEKPFFQRLKSSFMFS